MKRGKAKPDFDDVRLGTNPLANQLVIPVNKRFKYVIKKGVDMEEEHTIEATKFCKVYDFAGHREDMVKMPIRCKEMILYLIHSMEPGKDYIWIDRRAYMKNMGIKSLNTFRGIIKYLGLNLYLCPHIEIRDLYWVNPKCIFKGNRLHRFPMNVEVKYQSGKLNKYEDE